jgi:hypothetical protein
MAGDWIKMRIDLASSPKVVRIASALRADRLRVIGGLHAVWCLFDVHSVDGNLDGYTFEALDEMIGFPGFGQAMASVGWIEDRGDSLAAPRFDEHNGQSAKRRAMESERKRESRKTSASDADKMRTREEKRREDKNKEQNLLSEQSPDRQSGKHGTEEDHKAARWIFDRVRQVATSAKEPNWNGWANDIRLMRERDGRTHREICELFEWANTDSFWRANILSPDKLRDKWTALEAKRASGAPQSQRRTPQPENFSQIDYGSGVSLL